MTHQSSGTIIHGLTTPLAGKVRVWHVLLGSNVLNALGWFF